MKGRKTVGANSGLYCHSDSFLPLLTENPDMNITGRLLGKLEEGLNRATMCERIYSVSKKQPSIETKVTPLSPVLLNRFSHSIWQYSNIQ